MIGSWHSEQMIPTATTVSIAQRVICSIPGRPASSHTSPRTSGSKSVRLAAQSSYRFSLIWFSLAVLELMASSRLRNRSCSRRRRFIASQNLSQVSLCSVYVVIDNYSLV